MKSSPLFHYFGAYLCAGFLDGSVVSFVSCCLFCRNVPFPLLSLLFFTLRDRAVPTEASGDRPGHCSDIALVEAHLRVP